MRIAFAKSTTERVTVVVAHDAPTFTSARSAVAPTLSVGVQAAISTPLPIYAHTIHTPLRPQDFAQLLASQAFTLKLIHSLTHGFDIGYEGPRDTLIARNLRSAFEHPEVVDEALKSEVAENRMTGPYSSLPLPRLHCSGVGVVAMKDGSWRLINHLSAPVGSDFINPNEFSLQYSSIDEAIKICYELLAKVDLKNAFWQCPVRREDWEFLGIHWRNVFYVDKIITFWFSLRTFLLQHGR